MCIGEVGDRRQLCPASLPANAALSGPQQALLLLLPTSTTTVCQELSPWTSQGAVHPSAEHLLAHHRKLTQSWSLLSTAYSAAMR